MIFKKNYRVLERSQTRVLTGKTSVGSQFWLTLLHFGTQIREKVREVCEKCGHINPSNSAKMRKMAKFAKSAKSWNFWGPFWAGGGLGFTVIDHC